MSIGNCTIHDMFKVLIICCAAGIQRKLDVDYEVSGTLLYQIFYMDLFLLCVNLFQICRIVGEPKKMCRII